MRLERLQIRKFRNLENVELNIPREASLVCLIGENGAGKSNILEAIGGLATRLGIVQAIEFSRGSPLGEAHDLSATFYIDDEVRRGVGPAAAASEEYRRWDGTLIVESTQLNSTVRAGGDFGEDTAQSYGQLMASWLQSQILQTYVLWIDADRSYPPTGFAFQIGDMAAEGQSQIRKQKAAQSTRTKYGDWLDYLGRVYTSTAIRTFADAVGSPDHILRAEDPFSSYSARLAQVLPHLSFGRVTPSPPAIFFTNGVDSLQFNQLSGGEKELAFMVGQFDRYHLEKGLTLIDEPELHLNPDLVRRWIRFLRDASTTGQTWIATHSLEAVEEAGFENTYLIDKQFNSARSGAARRLSSEPAQRLLTGMLGFPAFSLSRQTFVLVEGERTGEERARFERLVEDSEFCFVESGGCAEVKRLVRALADLAEDLQHDLRVHGVIDSDERPTSELLPYQSDPLYTVLSCFEIENVFLDVKTVEAVAATLGKTVRGFDVVRDASDYFAGTWVLERTLLHVSKRPDELRAVKQSLMDLRWAQVVLREPRIPSDLELLVQDVAVRKDLENCYLSSVREYRKLRLKPDLPSRCMGKEVLDRVVDHLGFKEVADYEFLAREAWRTTRAPIPPALTALRADLAKRKR